VTSAVANRDPFALSYSAPCCDPLTPVSAPTEQSTTRDAATAAAFTEISSQPPFESDQQGPPLSPHIRVRTEIIILPRNRRVPAAVEASHHLPANSDLTSASPASLHVRLPTCVTITCLLAILSPSLAYNKTLFLVSSRLIIH